MHPQRKISIHPGGLTWANPGGPMMPLKLKRTIQEHGIEAAWLAENIRNKFGKALSRAAIYQCCNRGLIPEARCPDFREQMERLLRTRGVPEAEIAHIWDFVPEGEVVPMHVIPKRKTQPKAKQNPISETLKEAEMLTPTTMKHFKLFRNPFLDDVQEAGDVYMSQSHAYAHAAMMDAARNGGFVAVVGECGAGKSIMRRKLIADLNTEGDVRVIMPQTIDKGQLTSNHILDSIILDLDPDAHPRRSREAKARQVQRMLLESSRAGMRHVLVIEEAHDLSVPTMKQLKRLWEIEDGYRKVLGIVLIGQTELQARLNRQTHPEMREVILRCLIATLDPLARDECADYIGLKFRRIGKDAGEIIDGGVVDAVMARLTTRQGWSAVYPLYINNLLAKAMNYAAQIGSPLVTPDIIEAV